MRDDLLSLGGSGEEFAGGVFGVRHTPRPLEKLDQLRELEGDIEVIWTWEDGEYLLSFRPDLPHGEPCAER